MPTDPTLFDPGARPERRDAVRNRGLLLDAAQRLVDRSGVEGVTMDAVAAEAGVGKGTVFRRFGSRAGLMAALLDHSEARWQEQVISGPPPLGPGAPPLDRLLAFGASRLERNLASADLLVAAVGDRGRPSGALAFIGTHVRHLLVQQQVGGDAATLTRALLAPLDASVVRQQVREQGVDPAVILAGWTDLLHRVARPRDEPARPVDAAG